MKNFLPEKRKENMYTKQSQLEKRHPLKIFEDDY